MIRTVIQSLFPSAWLNHELGRYNAKLLDRHFGVDKKHHRIAHSLHYAKAIKSMITSHSARAKVIRFAPLLTHQATTSEKILLSHALLGNKLITQGCEDDQLKGYRLLNIAMNKINSKIDNSVSEGLLLPDIIRLIGESSNRFLNTSLGRALAAEQQK